MFHTLEINDLLDPFLKVIYRIPRGFPSKISQKILLDHIEPNQIEWLVKQNIISTQYGYYSLIDEFLRIRIFLEQDDHEISKLEKEILKIEDLNSDNFSYDPFN